jgi:hypothetical protein
MLSGLCIYRELLLVALVQAEQDALEARRLPDQDQPATLRELDRLAAADAAVVQAVRVDQAQTARVGAIRRGAVHSPAQSGLDQSQRITAPHPRAVKMNADLVFIA